jgi:hypothetical protein
VTEKLFNASTISAESTAPSVNSTFAIYHSFAGIFAMKTFQWRKPVKTFDHSFNQ